MPREARLDFPGMLYHIINRGIEKRKIFVDDKDRAIFVKRLGDAVKRFEAQCFAWALMPNHIHILLRAGPRGIAPIMRSLLTAYAVSFNLRHERAGHLFQNRYKSLICEEEAYFQELIRYIHLNPVRAGIVKDVAKLDTYPWTGHATLMGKQPHPWQDTHSALQEFGNSFRKARAQYKAFLIKGLKQEEPDYLETGIPPQAGQGMEQNNTHQPHDIRIIGSPYFIEKTLSKVEKQSNIQQELRFRSTTLEEITRLVARKYEVPYEHLKTRNRNKTVSKAKGELIYFGYEYLGKTLKEMAEWTIISRQAATKSYRQTTEIGDVGNFDYLLEIK